jgi:hypothetical protein
MGRESKNTLFISNERNFNFVATDIVEGLPFVRMNTIHQKPQCCGIARLMSGTDVR